MTWRVVSSPPTRISSDSCSTSSGLEPVAVDLGVHEHAHEVVGRVGLALRDRVRAERRVLLHRVHRAEELLLGGVAALRAHHVVGPPQQVVAVFGRDAEHVADQDHRQRRGDVAARSRTRRARTPVSMIASHVSRIFVLAVADAAAA